MSTHACATEKKVPSLTSATKGVLQRKCNCGGPSKLAGGCESCEQKRALKRAATRTFMETGFGHDFSKVRVAAEESPQHKGFTYEDLLAGEVKEEEEPEMLSAAPPEKTSPRKDELPHAGSATIVCESGDYVVKLNNWAGKPCGISDCVTVHESSHIDDWRSRWPKGCKKADGSNQADGYLPTGGDGYAEFLKKSECTAHTKDLECAEAKLKAATGDCKTKLEAYVKLTRDQKAGYC
jgi:hypothetical protein